MWDPTWGLGTEKGYQEETLKRLNELQTAINRNILLLFLKVQLNIVTKDNFEYGSLTSSPYVEIFERPRYL